MISDPQELYRFLATPGIEVAALMFASDDVVWASRRYIAEENVPNARHTKEVIGAFVNAGSRIHLYSYLNSLLREHCIAIPTPLSTFSRLPSPRCFKPATVWEP